jgi:uncharacterized membrane protein YfcA
MFKSKVFTTWFILAYCAWAGLFYSFDSISFFIAHWYYPATMVAGAFVAGFTPEGGGAVAFPVLNVFLHIDRVLARDFAMMIQSVGMTSASIYILTHKETNRKDYRPLYVFVPVAYLGMVLGFMFLQKIPVYLIQALFLCLSATFVIAYYFSDHRGILTELKIGSKIDYVYLGVVLVLGGMVSSLFGTGGDVLVYTLLVTRYNMTAKIATRMSIVLQASLSILGYLYRAFVDHGLAADQIRTWLCAFPVVLFMAPFGAYMLARLHVNWMLRAIIVLNCFQLLYFNFHEPSVPKVIASVVFTTILGSIFYAALKYVAQKFKSNRDPVTPVELAVRG